MRFRGVSVSLGGVVLGPVLAHKSLLWLSLLYFWLDPSFSCLRVWLLFWYCRYPGLSFSVGPLFYSATQSSSRNFLCFFRSKFFRLNLFPLPLFSCRTSLSCCPSSFNFPLFSHVVGSLLSPLDLCNTLKIKNTVYTYDSGGHYLYTNIA